MRPHSSLVHSRTRVSQRYALFPLEGYPFSRLPSFPEAQVRVLASPAIGAGFVQYLIELPAGCGGSFKADGKTETFAYVLAGTGEMNHGQQAAFPLSAGSFALLPPDEVPRPSKPRRRCRSSFIANSSSRPKASTSSSRCWAMQTM